ncbi:GNAT family N-acetyltransferase [Nocardioides anomalus]|uniref:GNAT family N-acetyltransferase n=1 Tax=Nocardioides anomalus TaxID=2712223 RepID=A0A6G6W9B9_9ACTN|nr:GNAT family N-acetyltransferase [Nocardioides anomalus]QIG41824.1 GNAT family N-acetyltransferase [Nocardioides anomalus]
MLWRVRTTLPDRPGALAALAEQCGLAEVNILGLQIFPGIESVTDELILRTPGDWAPERLVALVELAGATDVRALRCTEAALTDQPTRYVQAAQAILEQPLSFPDVLARLFDAEAEPLAAAEEADAMELTVADVWVQIHRAVPFTATEHARGTALAGLVSDVLARTPAPVRPPADGRPAYLADDRSVRAVVEGVVVGTARLGVGGDELGLTVDVTDGWRRRGVGTRLLSDACRLARDLGAEVVVLTTGSGNPAVLPLVLSAGLRGRIRMAGDELTVRIPVREMRPLTT